MAYQSLNPGPTVQVAEQRFSVAVDQCLDPGPGEWGSEKQQHSPVTAGRSPGPGLGLGCHAATALVPIDGKVLQCPNPGGQDTAAS